MNDYESKRIAQMYRFMDEGKSNMKDIIGLLRASAWFERVRIRLNAPNGDLSTPYAIGKYIQPHTYAKKSAGFYHNNLWAKYAQGKRIPGDDTVGQTERFLPGSTALLNSPKWWMLDCSRPLHLDQAASDTLSSPVRDCLFVTGDRRFGVRRSWDDTLELLSQRVNGLEALAAGVWVLREARQAGNSDIYLDIGDYLHGILLMALPFGDLYPIRCTLATYFFEFIFPLCSSSGITLNPDLQQLLKSAQEFEKFRWLYSESGVIEPFKVGDSSSWYKMLDGTLGWDLRFAFGPHYGVRDGVRNLEARRHVQGHRISRSCAFSVLGRGPAEVVPSKEVRLRVRAIRQASAVR